MSNCDDQVAAALESQFYRLPYPYHSRVKFVAEQAVSRTATGFEYVTRAGVVREAFSYAIGDIASLAGYSQADGPATPNMTNLEKARETIGGDRLFIRGISLIAMPAAQHVSSAADEFRRTRMADAQYLAGLMSSLSLEVKLNGARNGYRLGHPLMLPGNGGLLGGLGDSMQLRPFNGPIPASPFAANGWPTVSNYFPLPDGLTWNPAGKAQSLLSIRFTVDRDIEIQSGGYETPQGDRAEDNAPGNVATGEQEYAFPTELVQEFHVVLIGVTDGPRGSSS